MNRELQKQKHVPLEWLLQVDRILRGEATGPTNLQGADIKIPIVGISFIVILMAIVYGFCMGIFSLVRGVENNEYHQALLQTLASMAKVPLLFCLTLLVTFPSLYVFNALVGSRLRIVQVLKLLLASLVVNLAVLVGVDGANSGIFLSQYSQLSIYRVVERGPVHDCGSVRAGVLDSDTQPVIPCRDRGVAGRRPIESGIRSARHDDKRREWTSQSRLA